MENTTTQKKKRYWIPVIIILILGSIGFGLWYHFSKSPDKDEHIEALIPHVNMTNISITDIDGEHIKLVVHASLINPLPASLSTKRIQYKIFIDTAMIVESSYDEPLNVKSKDSTVLDIPLEVSLKRMLGIFEAFKKQNTDSADYSVKAVVFADLPVAGEQTFNFNITKRMPAIILPEIKIAETDIKKLGFSNSGIDMSFIITNPNSFPIKLKNGNIKVTVDDNVELVADMKDVINIPARGKETVPVRFDLKTNKLGNVIWKVLFEKKDTRFTLLFKGKLDTETDILKNTNLVITADGTLAEAFETIDEIKK